MQCRQPVQGEQAVEEKPPKFTETLREYAGFE